MKIIYFISQNTLTENMAWSVYKDTAFNAVDMLFRGQNICRYCSCKCYNLTSNKTWPDLLDISDNELVQTCEKIASTACKEGNNLDYQTN